MTVASTVVCVYVCVGVWVCVCDATQLFNDAHVAGNKYSKIIKKPRGIHGSLRGEVDALTMM